MIDFTTPGDPGEREWSTGQAAGSARAGGPGAPENEPRRPFAPQRSRTEPGQSPDPGGPATGAAAAGNHSSGFNERTYDQRSYEGWQSASGGWERESAYIRRAGRPVSEWMLGRLSLAPGMVLLEIAGGLGDTAMMAAPALLPDGRVILTDRSPAMMEAARRRVEAEGLDNIECRAMDGAALDLPDSSVDAAVCRWGYMLMSDPALALRETLRVLRPGGRLALSVWGPPAENTWAGIITDRLLDRGLIEPADPTEPSMFALDDPERLRALVEGSGFTDLELQTVPTAWVYESGEDFWRVQTGISPTAQKGLARLDQGAVAAVKAEVVAEVDAQRIEGEVHLPATCIVLAASRPSDR